MRIKRSDAPPPFLNSRDQMRMLKLLGALVLVLVAIKVTSNPQMWAWIFSDEAVQQEPAKEEAAPPQEQEKIDRTLRGDDEADLKSDEFLSRPAPEAQDPQADPAANEDGPPVEKRPDEAETSPDASAKRPIRPGDASVEIDPAVLEPVLDNTVNVRRDEADAYFHILAQARDLPQSALEQAARDDVGYTVLMVDSEHYRGRLLTIEGDLRKLTPLNAVENPYGLEQLYDAWIFTADSGNNPYRVVCTSIPAGIPQGERIQQRVPVRVTGYFFKRESYATADGLRLHTAPLILAQRIGWSASQTAEQEQHSLVPYLVIFMVAVGAALAATLWRFRVSDRRFQRGHLKRMAEAPPEAIDALEHLETTDVNDLFRELAETESAESAARKPDHAT